MDLEDLNSIRGKAVGGQYKGIMNWDQNTSNTAQFTIVTQMKIVFDVTLFGFK